MYVAKDRIVGRVCECATMTLQQKMPCRFGNSMTDNGLEDGVICYRRSALARRDVTPYYLNCSSSSRPIVPRLRLAGPGSPTRPSPSGLCAGNAAPIGRWSSATTTETNLASLDPKLHTHFSIRQLRYSFVRCLHLPFSFLFCRKHLR